MRFRDPRLELQFLTDTDRQKSRLMLLVHLLVVMVNGMYLLADWILVPDVFNQALFFRLALLMPYGLVLAALQVFVIGPRLRERLVVSMDLLTATVHTALCLTSQDAQAQLHLVGLTVVMLYATSHLRVHFWSAVFVTVTICGLFMLAAMNIHQPQWPVIWSIGLMLAGTGVFTLYSLYGLEVEDRNNYLMSVHQAQVKLELRNTNKLLQRVSRIDVLTQVANRRHFDLFLDHVWDRAKRDAQPVSILMVDVDHFKAYNDHFGHPKGDQCLVAVAKAAYDTLRKPGDLVARFGGEEFIAVLHKTDESSALAAAERVRQAVLALQIAHPKSQVGPWVTVSIGVATLKADTPRTSPKTLIAMADEALYEAKNQGRDRVVAHQQRGAWS